MGGVLNWTMRLPDGVEHRMKRHTGDLPNFIGRPAFFAGKPSHLADTVEHWLSHKADWDENAGQRPFRLRGTPDLGPYPSRLGPTGYGLVVTDFISGTILSNQCYSVLDSISFIWIDYGSTKERQTWQSSFANKYLREHAMVDARRIKAYTSVTRCSKAVEAVTELGGSYQLHENDNDYYKVRIPGTTPFPQVVDFLWGLPQVGDDSITMGTRGEVDTNPMSVEHFQDTSVGWMQMKQRVLDLGFTMTDEDHILWDETIFMCSVNEDEATQG